MLLIDVMTSEGMRRINLSSNDFSLFGHEISPVDYEYFIKHKDAFRRMWIEQGQKFWFIFVMTFKKFAKKNILMSPLPQIGEDVRSLSDLVFRALVSEFILGKQNQAKRLIDDIINVARNRHSIQYLESKSLAKDPFYHKETRDAFRNLFGEPNHRITYAKVYLYMVMYLKFGGSVMECLRIWLKAEEWTPDEGWFVPRFEPGEFDLGIDGYIMYLMETNHGCKSQPLFLDNWSLGHPRLYQHDKNPLYDEGWAYGKDWRDNLSLDLFEKFIVFFMTFSCSVCKENACDECKRLHESIETKPPASIESGDVCGRCDHGTRKKSGKKGSDQSRLDAIKLLEKRAKAVSVLQELSPKELVNAKECMLTTELEMYTEDDFLCTDDEYETVDEEEEFGPISKAVEHNLDTAIDILLNPPTAVNLPKLKLDTIMPPTSGERGELDQAVVTKNQVTKSVSDIASIVNDMAERVSDVVTRVNNFADKTKDDEGFKARTTVEELQDSVERAKAAVSKAQGSVAKNETVDQAKSALLDAIEAMKTANDLTGRAADTVEKWRGNINSAHDVVGRATQTIEKTEDTIRQTKDTIEKTKDEMIRTRQQIEQSKLANELIKEYVLPLSDEELVSALFGMKTESQARKKSRKAAEKRVNDQHRRYLDEGLRSMLPKGLIPENQQIIDASLPLSDADIGRTVSIVTEEKATGDRLVYTISFPRCSDLSGGAGGDAPEATVHVSKDVDLFNARDDWTRASDCFPADDVTATLEASLKENYSINERIRQRVLEEVSKNTSLSEEMKKNLIEQVEKQVFKEVVEHARDEMASQARKDRKRSRRRKKVARQLRRCANCQREEIVAKEFKKCQMCKEVGAQSTRYYCGKECQVIDWKARHRQEHADKNV